MKKIATVSILILTVAGITIFSSANSSLSTEFNHRIQIMQKLESAVTLLETLSEANSSNLSPFDNAADEIQRHSGQNMIGLFPVNDPEKEGSILKSLSWEEIETFEAYALRLHLLAESLRSSLKKNPFQIAGAEPKKLPPKNPDKMLSGVEMPNMQELSRYPASQLIPLIRENCNACHSRFKVSN